MLRKHDVVLLRVLVTEKPPNEGWTAEFLSKRMEALMEKKFYPQLILSMRTRLVLEGLVRPKSWYILGDEIKKYAKDGKYDNGVGEELRIIYKVLKRKERDVLTQLAIDLGYMDDE